MAFLLYLSGKPAQALEEIQKAINLNPLPPDTYLNTLGYTYYLLDRPEEAIPVLEDVYQRQLWSTTGLLLVASYVATGRTKEAKVLAKENQRLNFP